MSFKDNLEIRIAAWFHGRDVALLESVPGIDELVWSETDIIALPSSLTPKERKIVHSISANIGVHHMSVGNGVDRRILLSRSGDFETNNFGINIVEEEASLYASPWYDDSVIKPLVISHVFKANTDELQAKQFTVQHIAKHGVRNDFIYRTDFSSSFSVPEDLSGFWGNECDHLKLPAAKLIDTEESLFLAAQVLSQSHEVAFDGEMHSFRSYNGITALLQLSCFVDEIQADYIIDTLALWDAIGPILGPIFANPKIVKIGHSIRSMDIPFLYKDFGIIVVNGFDTQDAAVTLGSHSLGLGALLGHWRCPLEEEISSSKEFMKHVDWRRRPLSAEMIRYAQLDVHFLIQVYALQVRALCQLSSVDSMTDRRVAAAKKSKRTKAHEGLTKKRNARKEGKKVKPKDKSAPEMNVHPNPLDVGTNNDITGDSMNAVDARSLSVHSVSLTTHPSSRSALAEPSGGQRSLTLESASWDEVDPDAVVWGQEDGAFGGSDAVDSFNTSHASMNHGFDHEGEFRDIEGLVRKGAPEHADSDEDWALDGAGDGDDDLWDGWGVVDSPGHDEITSSLQVITCASVSTALPILPEGVLVEDHAALSASERVLSTITTTSSSQSSSSLGNSEEQGNIFEGREALQEVFQRTAQSCANLWRGCSPADNAYTKVSSFKEKLKSTKKKSSLAGVGGGSANTIHGIIAGGTSTSRWCEKNTFVFKELFKWREIEARRRDESLGYICPTSLLVDAAERLPLTQKELCILINPLPRSMREEALLPLSEGGGNAEKVPAVDLPAVIVGALKMWEQMKVVA